MSEMGGHQRPDDTVPHQDAHEDVIAAEAPALVDAQLIATSDHAAIADLAAPSAAYVEAEQVAQTDKINEILDVLRDAGLIPAA